MKGAAMDHISRETPEQTHERLLEVIAATTFKVYDDAYVFEEAPLRGPIPPLDDRTLALVRDDRVWSRLVPAALDHGVEQFGLLRFHFPEGVDNSGFVGWLASHLKRELGTGVFVVCGQNSEQGGIFDYWGFPAELREAVLREIEKLRGARKVGPAPSGRVAE
jgi:hypothetical protein